MAEGFLEGVVDNVSVRTKTTSIDGVDFFLAVLRDENGTQVVVDAIEAKPGYPCGGDGTTLHLHDQPYDPSL